MNRLYNANHNHINEDDEHSQKEKNSDIRIKYENIVTFEYEPDANM